MSTQLNPHGVISIPASLEDNSFLDTGLNF